jgi:hypothetical protein
LYAIRPKSGYPPCQNAATTLSRATEVFGDRRFDASKAMIPASWVGTEDLEFLGADDQLTLNHVRAFSYPHLFGNYAEFIPISLGEIAQQSWHDDRSRLRALARFGEEEMKHQQLFLRAEAVMEESCGYSFGRYFDPGKQRVTTLEWARGHAFSVRKQAALREALYRSMNAIWVDVSLSHPRFVQLATELSREGSARLGIA